MARMASDTRTYDFAFDSGFDPARGIRLDNLPPFARRLRTAADMVGRTATTSRSCVNSAPARSHRNGLPSTCCRTTVISPIALKCTRWH